MSFSRLNDIVEALEAVCASVDDWRCTRNKRLEPYSTSAGGRSDIVEAPDAENFEAGLRRVSMKSPGNEEVTYGCEMGHHKINISIVGQEANPITVGTSKICRFSIDLKQKPICLRIAGDC